MVLRNAVPRQGTETSFWNLFHPYHLLRNAVPRQGTETLDFATSALYLVLRNAVPRQGTETKTCDFVESFRFIEKCSSPTGDGN